MFLKVILKVFLVINSKGVKHLDSTLLVVPRPNCTEEARMSMAHEIH